MFNPAFTALWADQYALTMAQALFTNGRHKTQAVFHAFIREAPFGGSYLVSAGQNLFFDWLEKGWIFTAEDIALLAQEELDDVHPLYTPEFLNFLATAKLDLTIDAMPEGELAFADVPIYRVQGPLWQCLMIEGALLNILNSQSLFATLASHVVELAAGAPVLEFGLRRAQALGSLEAARGTYIGGAMGTSNVLARKFFGVPSVGTMAHAYVMTYESELEAFADYARAMPYNGVFLVDTYHSLQGVKNAVAVCKQQGITLKGIRLDSGDVAFLAIQARKILDAAGYQNAKIVASDSLNYKKITELKAMKVPIDIWAMGNYLVNSPDQVSVGPVYKMAAVQDDAGQMRDVIKLSETASKSTIPGAVDVVRYLHQDALGQMRFDGDTIVPFDGVPLVQDGSLARDILSVEKIDDTNTRLFKQGVEAYLPLVRAYTDGVRVMGPETVQQVRTRAQQQLAMLEPSLKGMPARYPYRVGLEEGLHDRRKAMIRDMRRQPKKH